MADFVPFQFTARRHGSQIDTLRKPLQTLFNEAIGLEARRVAGGTTVRGVRFNGYVLGFQDNSFIFQLPYRYGRALYLNTTLETRCVNLMLSCWPGDRFSAPLGGTYYQSLSSSVTDPRFLDPARPRLLVRRLRDSRIPDAVAAWPGFQMVPGPGARP